LIWLLRLRWSGRDWYLASRPCAPEIAGGDLPHMGTLVCDGWGEALDMGGGVTGAAAASLTLDLGLPESWQELAARGIDLAGAWGELSLWREGTTYAERHVLLYGRILMDTAPPDGEPAEVTLTDELVAPAEVYPPANAVASTDTWVGLPDESDGKPYPFPMGSLGAYTRNDGSANTAGAWYAIVVDDTGGAEKALVAGAPIHASTVTIQERDTLASDTFAVTTEYDGLGRLVSVVDLSAKTASWTLDGSVDLLVRDMTGRGIYGSIGAEPIDGLGDACLHLLLQRYSADGPARVDVGRWQSARTYLAGWRVGLLLEEGEDPLDTLADRLLGMCPALWIMPGPAGFRPVILADTDATTAPHLEIGRNADRLDDGTIEILDTDPITSCTARYAYGQTYGRTRAKITIGPDEDPRAAAGATIRAGSLDFECATYDRGTAALAASEYIRLAWTQPRYLEVTCAARDALQLELGAKVRYTDADIGISERPLYVQGRETGEDGEVWTLTLIGWW